MPMGRQIRCIEMTMLLALAAAFPAYSKGLVVGEPAPSITLHALDGRDIDTRALRGKVVLVDFWEYTCINWIRTSPYVKAWNRDYAALGLVVGVVIALGVAWIAVALPVVLLVFAHVIAREGNASMVGFDKEKTLAPWVPFAWASFICFGLTLRALMTGLGVG